jgi:hypothetical protein
VVIGPEPKDEELLLDLVDNLNRIQVQLAVRQVYCRPSSPINILLKHCCDGRRIKAEPGSPDGPDKRWVSTGQGTVDLVAVAKRKRKRHHWSALNHLGPSFSLIPTSNNGVEPC